MSVVLVDVTRETCPVPLLEMRIALKEAKVGDTVIVKGTHMASKKDIQIAVEMLEYELLDVCQDGEVWEISIKKSENSIYE
jgi:TusA-related sulfurtransferase